MEEKAVIAVVRYIVDLQAENRAMWEILRKAAIVPQKWPPPELIEARRKLHSIPVVAGTLGRNDVSQVEVLLSTLATVQPV